FPVSVASPPRSPRPATAAPSSVLDARPMRNPNLGSRAAMTRRGWWLVILNFLIPGSAQVLAGNRRLGRFGLGATLVLWVVLILLGLGALLWPEGTFSIVTGAWVPDWLRLLRPVPMLIAQG